MKSLRDEIRILAHRMDEEDDAASDLWSWLPSHDEAKKHHGDYWQSVRPDCATVMREAAKFLAALSHGVTPEMRESIIAAENGRSDWFGCPCGEYHDEDAPIRAEEAP